MKNLLVVLFISLVGNGLAARLRYEYYDVDNAEFYFKKFMERFGKSYASDAEYQQRFEIFKKKLHQINEWNEVAETSVYGINQFADLTHEEVTQSFMGHKGNLTSDNVIQYVSSGTAPASLDYRDKNWVTPVKSQGQCGSCYVFSAIGEIEGQYAKQHHQLVSLSEQQGLDCDQQSHGCDGGWPANVMNALARQGGSVKEEDYPYRERKGYCHTPSSKIIARVQGGQQVMMNDEEHLKNLLAEHGPLAIALDFSPSLSSYTGGIAEGFDCYSPHASHALVLIGYGTEGDVPYWLIKNSWSPMYGESGYLRLIRGQNKCKVLSYIAKSTVA